MEGGTTEHGVKNKQEAANRGRLEEGLIYTGVIRNVNSTRQDYTIQVDGGEKLEGCVLALGMFSGLMGMKMSIRLPIGTSVLLAYDGASAYIVGCVAADNTDENSYLNRYLTGKGDHDAGTTLDPDNVGSPPPHTQPCDLFDGEFEIGNLAGPFIRFMTFMTSMGAGEQAKVEFHLLRDLVRVVSRNFEHFSALGEMKIYHDGRLNMEFNGTTYDHERWGKETEKEAKAELDGASVKLEDIDDRIETGRWRVTKLFGFMGDLLNTWFTDPAVTAGKFAEDALRCGKARMHVGQDGAVLVQSMSDIVLERVCAIPVPIRIKHQENPSGVVATEMDKLERKYLKIWDDKNGETGHHTLYKIREYARYLNQFHSLARIHQFAQGGKAEWYVPTEEEAPDPEHGADEADREEATSGNTYWHLCYSTIRIFRDGAILLHDAVGNTVSMGETGVQFSSTTNLHLYAAGDIVAKAGNSMFLGARRHMEMVASRGGMRIKARAFLHGLCEKGTLWLKSDADPDDLEPEDEDDPEPEMIGEQGVRVEATLAQGYWLTHLKSLIQACGEDEDEDKVSVILRSLEGNVKTLAKKDVTFKAERNMLIKVTKDVTATFSAWINAGTSWLFTGAVKITAAGLEATSVIGGRVDAIQRLAGPERGAEPVDTSYSTCCLAPHFNHVDKVYENLEVEIDSERPDMEKAEVEDEAPGGQIVWDFFDADEYAWSGRDEDQFYEPLSQQKIRLEEPALSDDQLTFGDWEGAADPLLENDGSCTGGSTGTKRDWPGDDARWLQHEPSKPTLDEPTGEKPETFSPDIQTDLVPKTITMKYRKKE